MSEQGTGEQFDASTFNLDEWIDDVKRPEVVVPLYQNDDEYRRRVAEIEAMIPGAEKSRPEDRGLDEPAPEQLAAMLRDLQAERERTALRVKVRQITDAESTTVVLRAQKAGASVEEVGFWVVAEACVEPTFTVDQLKRLHLRDVSGERMVNQLVSAVNSLRASGLPVPS